MLCFGSVHYKGVAGAFCVSADSKGDSTKEGGPSAGLRTSSRPFDSAPFEAPFGTHGKQGKQGRQSKVEGGKSKEVAGAARVSPPPGVFCKSGKQRG